MNTATLENSCNSKKTQKKKGRFTPGILVALTCLFLLPAVASAERLRLQIDMGDTVFQAGHNQTAVLPLKRLLRQQYPGIKLQNMELKRVVLVAKSKGGHGLANLRVGNKVSRERLINGQPQDFNRRSTATFDKVRFFNPAGSTRGTWQLQLKGKVKVRKVIVIAEDHQRRRRPCKEFCGTTPHHF
ncbi:hypothetical protein JWG39_02580 [Desulforhopalus vacuolatus]|uniref:hypothetical protein n=1 Tax=Desulforhopalus vacuolatus TaxID=40414 RepID=UPI001962F5D8|nr:hypothetical protein [Desulforhopalus vacuolatus]MBM9518703.1 hypothetical protein [Desulforhopalus vacuolatus]